MDDFVSRASPMRWCLVGDTQVSFLDVDEPIPDELWDQCMDARKQPEVQRLLVVIAGGGFPQITHRQWRYSASIMIQRRFPVAVLSSHRATLAIVRSANWNGAKIQAFPLSERDEALAFIGLPPEQHPGIHDTLHQLASERRSYRPSSTRPASGTR